MTSLVLIEEDFRRNVKVMEATTKNFQNPDKVNQDKFIKDSMPPDILN